MGDIEPKYVLVDSTKVLLTEMDNLASDIRMWLQERIPLTEKQWYLPVDSGICFITNTDVGQCVILHDDFNVKQVPIDIADGVYVAPLVDFVYPPKEFCFFGAAPLRAPQRAPHSVSKRQRSAARVFQQPQISTFGYLELKKFS